MTTNDLIRYGLYIHDKTAVDNCPSCSSEDDSIPIRIAKEKELLKQRLKADEMMKTCSKTPLIRMATVEKYGGIKDTKVDKKQCYDDVQIPLVTTGCQQS